MTDDRQDGSGGTGPDREGASLPPELDALDEELRRVRFEPRRGLESDVLSRLAAEGGEANAAAAPDRGPGRRPPLRRAAAAVAVLALVASVGLLARAASGGGDDAAPTAAAPAVDRPAAETDGDERFAIRWGRDARVLALGTGAGRAGEKPGHGLRCRRVGERVGCRGTRPGPAHFAAARGPAVLRDFCCLDYDGGGPADDGVRVVAGQGEAVVSFWIYEDLDGTGSFTDGDLLRTVVDGDGAGGIAGPPGPVRELDRCCVDLDGGPRPDDGLFVLAAGGQRVALAVLYEDVNGDGRLSPGDRLRALRTTPPGAEPGLP